MLAFHGAMKQPGVLWVTAELQDPHFPWVSVCSSFWSLCLLAALGIELRGALAGVAQGKVFPKEGRREASSWWCPRLWATGKCSVCVWFRNFLFLLHFPLLLWKVCVGSGFFLCKMKQLKMPLSFHKFGYQSFTIHKKTCAIRSSLSLQNTRVVLESDFWFRNLVSQIYWAKSQVFAAENP